MTPLSQVESPDQLFHGLGPIWSAIRIANPAYTSTGPLTFRPLGTFSAAANHWRDTIFVPHVLPIFLQVLAHARAGRAQEIVPLDHSLSGMLSETASAASRTAGRRLAEVAAGIRGDRTLGRLADWTIAGRTDGHLAVLFAARCAVFSMPDRRAVGAYLFQEIHAGAPDAPLMPTSNFVAACLEALPAVPFHLRAA